MVAQQLVRRYAHNQKISAEVADQEIALHYALRLLNEAELVGRLPDGSAGPLLFKGGTALRKCFFGSQERFSQDIDLDAPQRNGFDGAVEEAFVARNPFHDIRFSFANTRWSEDENENFSGTVAYEHPEGGGRFELQLSYRMHPVLDPRDLILAEQEYFKRVEFEAPVLHGLDIYEMVGEKIMACNRRQGGSAKDVYDLYLWTTRPFDEDLVRRIAVLKAWTDQRRSPRFEPSEFLSIIEPGRFRWEDIDGLVPRGQHGDRREICRQVRDRFSFLETLTGDEPELLGDQTAHRERGLYEHLREDARELASAVNR